MAGVLTHFGQQGIAEVMASLFGAWDARALAYRLGPRESSPLASEEAQPHPLEDERLCGAEMNISCEASPAEPGPDWQNYPVDP